MSLKLLTPDWPAPSNVRTGVTTRQGGVSAAPWTSLNLGTHVGDDPQAVAANRAALRTLLPAEPSWLEQVHGVDCVNAASISSPVVADASFSRDRHVVCTVMTADCLPVLLCNTAGTVVAAAHAGWRGLCAGVLERTVVAMENGLAVPGELMAWLGPAIGPSAFEVGPEVRAAFLAISPDADTSAAFEPKGDKYLCDIYALAKLRLRSVGVSRIYGGEHCTVTNNEWFYSYRRDGVTGRMASLIWLD